jgi:hypothetical protein
MAGILPPPIEHAPYPLDFIGQMKHDLLSFAFSAMPLAVRCCSSRNRPDDDAIVVEVYARVFHATGCFTHHVSRVSGGG